MCLRRQLQPPSNFTSTRQDQLYDRGEFSGRQSNEPPRSRFTVRPPSPPKFECSMRQQARHAGVRARTRTPNVNTRKLGVTKRARSLANGRNGALSRVRSLPRLILPRERKGIHSRRGTSVKRTFNSVAPELGAEWKNVTYRSRGVPRSTTERDDSRRVRPPSLTHGALRPSLARPPPAARACAHVHTTERLPLPSPLPGITSLASVARLASSPSDLLPSDLLFFRGGILRRSIVSQVRKCSFSSVSFSSRGD